MSLKDEVCLNDDRVLKWRKIYSRLTYIDTSYHESLSENEEIKYHTKETKQQRIR